MHSLVGISWHMWYAKVWHGKGRVGVGAQVGAMPGAPVGARHSAMGGGVRVGYCLILHCFAYPSVLGFGLSQCALLWLSLCALLWFITMWFGIMWVWYNQGSVGRIGAKECWPLLHIETVKSIHVLKIHVEIFVALLLLGLI